MKAKGCLLSSQQTNAETYFFCSGSGGHILETSENWGEKRTVRKEDKENILDRDTEKDTKDRE